MPQQISFFSCPNCGAPLSSQVKEQGKERCLYCDVESVFSDQHVHLSSGIAPTPKQRLLGKTKRFGTLFAAPLVGFFCDNTIKRSTYIFV